MSAYFQYTSRAIPQQSSTFEKGFYTIIGRRKIMMNAPNLVLHERCICVKEAYEPALLTVSHSKCKKI